MRKKKQRQRAGRLGNHVMIVGGSKRHSNGVPRRRTDWTDTEGGRRVAARKAMSDHRDYGSAHAAKVDWPSAERRRIGKCFGDRIQRRATKC